VREMFWVRWRSLWKISWLLWRRHKLQPHEEKFLREARDILRRHRKLSPKQHAWLDILYDRERRRQRTGWRKARASTEGLS
jgi:hypothetical protein